MKLIDKRKEFCPASCGTKFKKSGVLGFVVQHKVVDGATLSYEFERNKSLFDYECPNCGMSYELDITELENLGFIIEEDDNDNRL